MACNCLKSNNIIVCPDTLYVGSVSHLNTDVVVYIRNITTGRIKKYESTSSAGGRVTIDTSSTVFNEGHSYEVKIVLATAVNPNDNEMITLDGFESCCVYFTATNTYEGTTLDTGIAAELSVDNCANTETPSESVVRYKQTATDYIHTSNIYIIGITDTTSVRTITLCDPADFPTGQILTIKDESGTASLNPPLIVGDIEGLGSINIVSDFGGWTLYSDGVSEWFIEASI